MVAIKEAKMPKCCGKCKYGQRFNPDEDICLIDGHIIKSTLATITQNRDSNCPLIDIEKPKVGHWKYDKCIDNWKCSECWETPKTMGYVGNADFMKEHFKFCNHCGARMIEVQND